MKPRKLSPRQALILGLFILALASLACSPIVSQSSTTGPDRADSSTTVLAPGTRTAAATATEIASPGEPLPASTAPVAAPGATPAPEAQPLTVLDRWFARTGPGRLSYAFLVENPNPDLALVKSRYQILAFDEAGTQLGKSGGTIDLVFPGQRLGVTILGSMVVPEDVPVSRVEVQVEPGQATATGVRENPLTPGQSEFFPGSPGSQLSVVIENSLAQPVEDVQVAALAYDASGAFMSASVGRIDLIPARGQAAATIRLETTDEPASVDFYPSLSVLPPLSEPAAPSEAFRLEGSWFDQQYALVHFAFVFENPNPSLSFEGSTYQVAAYDESGTVLGTYSHSLPVVFPGQRLGVAGLVNLLGEAQVSRLDVQIVPGKSKPSELVGGPFTTEQVVFTDAAFSKVAGIVKSSLDSDVQTLGLTAVAYDEQGAIVGGGESWLDFMPAQGQAAATVDLQTSGEPSRVELFARLHEHSRLQEAAAVEAALQVVASGFLRDSNSGNVVVAFIVENPSQTLTFLDTACEANVYNEAGAFLGTTGCDIPVLFPQERLGVVRTLLASEAEEVTRLEVQLRPQETVVSELAANPFTAEQVKFVPLGSVPQATGLIKSSLDRGTNITLTAVAYDESGAIIGGGWSNAFAEAYGQGEVSFYVAVAGQQQPARLEIYPTFQSHADLLP